MQRAYSAALVVLLVVIGLVGAYAQEATAPPLSPEERERFLLDADLSDYRFLSEGVTRSRRATASDGELTHDVHIQTVDMSRRLAFGEINFRDSYLYNVAAYRVAVLLGLDCVPMSVERRVRGERAAVTWWVDDVAMDENARRERRTWGPNPAATYQQIYTMHVFDELIRNADRNRGNQLWTSDWKMWLIDHTRAFRLDDEELSRPEMMLRVPGDLLGRLRNLTPEALAEAVGDSLDRPRQRSLMRRRDLLVQHFDDLIDERGEGAVIIR